MRDTISPAQISRRPHRLVAQDGALSRPKQGFESPWGHRFAKDRQQIMLSGFVYVKVEFKGKVNTGFSIMV